MKYYNIWVLYFSWSWDKLNMVKMLIDVGVYWYWFKEGVYYKYRWKMFGICGEWIKCFECIFVLWKSRLFY